MRTSGLSADQLLRQLVCVYNVAFKGMPMIAVIFLAGQGLAICDRFATAPELDVNAYSLIFD